jgi:hypothetical protein
MFGDKFFYVLHVRTAAKFRELYTVKYKTEKRTSASDLRTFSTCVIYDFPYLYVIDFDVHLLLMHIYFCKFITIQLK